MKKANIHPFEIEEFACKLVGLDYDEIDADTQIIEEHLYEKFGMNLEQFYELISILLPMIDVGESPLTGKIFKGFADFENECWLIKIQVE